MTLDVFCDAAIHAVLRGWVNISLWLFDFVQLGGAAFQSGKAPKAGRIHRFVFLQSS